MRFNAFKEIDRETALTILSNINQPDAADIIENLKARCTDEFGIQRDITGIQKSEKESKTTKEALIDARLGQGKFRADLMQIWNNSCAVTGCKVLKMLRAC